MDQGIIMVPPAPDWMRTVTISFQVKMLFYMIHIRTGVISTDDIPETLPALFVRSQEYNSI